MTTNQQADSTGNTPNPFVDTALLHAYVKEEHGKYMHSQGDKLPDETIGLLTSAMARVMGLNDNSGFLTSLLDTATRGKSPSSSFDNNIKDLHAWCVDDIGNICDYPDDQNQHGFHSTKNIVRRPWDAHVVCEALPHLDRDYISFSISVRNMSKSAATVENNESVLSKEELLKLIQSNKFPQNHCYARAKILRDSNPEKYALVIGSLGYKQSDGSIFWEFG